MQLNLSGVLEIANKNPVCWLATTQGDQPRVRGLLMWYADPSGFYFHTSSKKSLADQIKANPKVEGLFYETGQNPNDGRAIRVTGTVEIVEDEALAERLYRDRPWLIQIGEAHPDSKLTIFRIVRGEAFVWNMEVNMHESEIERIRF